MCVPDPGLLCFQGGNVHVYSAIPKRTLAAEVGMRPPFMERFFVRSVSLTSKFVQGEVESIFVESLNALELKLADFENAFTAKVLPATTLNTMNACIGTSSGWACI